MGSYPIMAGTPSKSVHVRLSESEAALLRDKCASLQMSKTDFVKLCIHLPIELIEEGSSPAHALIGIDRKSIKGILTEAKRWGNNFNQGTRALNAIGLKCSASASTKERSDSLMQNSARAMELMDKAHEGMREVERLARAMAKAACIPVPED